MKFSIIIPIYNVEQYLAECLDSLLAQTYRDLEMILVNDGSTDKSLAIAESYQKKDPRIILISQENQGLSGARNTGMRRATGDYILFLDSDDYFDDPKAVEKLAGRIQLTRPDILNFSYIKYFEDTGIKQPYFHGIGDMTLSMTDFEDQVSYLMKHGLYIASACNKAIRRAILDEETYFRTGIYSEDIEWCAMLLHKSGSLDFACMNFYCYRQRAGSITHTMSREKVIDLRNNIFRTLKIARKSKDPVRLLLLNYACYMTAVFVLSQSLTEDFQKDIVKSMSRLKGLFRYRPHNRRVLIPFIGTTLMGYYPFCWLIWSLQSLRCRISRTIKKN